MSAAPGSAALQPVDGRPLARPAAGSKARIRTDRSPRPSKGRADPQSLAVLTVGARGLASFPPHGGRGAWRPDCGRRQGPVARSCRCGCRLEGVSPRNPGPLRPGLPMPPAAPPTGQASRAQAPLNREQRRLQQRYPSAAVAGSGKSFVAPHWPPYERSPAGCRAPQLPLQLAGRSYANAHCGRREES